MDLRNEVPEEHRLKEHGKLGLKLTFDPRVPLLAHYVARTATVPLECHRTFYGFPYSMLGNDRVGDCEIASCYHAIMHARKGAHRNDVPLDAGGNLTACTLQSYSAITGYNPSDPSTDQGTNPSDSHAYWQNTGLLLPDGSRDKIAGTAQILPHDAQNIRRAIWEFDSADLAIALPVAWQQAGHIWDVGGDPLTDPAWAPGSWGGHAVRAVSYDSKYVAVVTWGKIALITWQALGTYGQIVLAELNPDVIGRGGVTQTGVDLTRLASDLPLL